MGSWGKPLLIAGAIGKASGPVASFADGDGNDFRKVLANIVAVQPGSGDPSPDNVRPISGWTGLNLSLSGADTSTPTIIPITFPSPPGTVYGGTLDLTTGVLTVTTDFRTLRGTETWISQGSENSKYYRTQIGGARENVYVYAGKSGCSHFAVKEVLSNNTNVGFHMNGVNSSYIAIRPGLTVYDTVTAFKSFLADQYAAGTPVFCYWTRVASAYQIYQLTPQQIQTFVGVNNVWADTGAVDVEYTKRSLFYIS